MLSNPLITGSSQGFRKACTRTFYSISTVRLTGSRFVVRVSSKSSNNMITNALVCACLRRDNQHLHHPVATIGGRMSYDGDRRPRRTYVSCQDKRKRAMRGFTGRDIARWSVGHVVHCTLYKYSLGELRNRASLVCCTVRLLLVYERVLTSAESWDRISA